MAVFPSDIPLGLEKRFQDAMQSIAAGLAACLNSVHSSWSRADSPLT